MGTPENDPFLFKYPLWTCLTKEGGIVGAARVTGGGLAVPVFTDEDLAERFLDAIGMKDKGSPKPIHDAAKFADFLKALQGAGGYSEIRFDMTGKEEKSRWTSTIENLLGEMEKH